MNSEAGNDEYNVNNMRESMVIYKAYYNNDSNLEVEYERAKKSLAISKKMECKFLKVEDFNLKEINKNFTTFVKAYFTKDNEKYLSDVNKKLQLENLMKLSEPFTAGPLSTLDFLVETTYNSDQRLKNIMLEQLNYLEKVAFRWRNIGGDGNCYYRSVIYCYLENIVFEKNLPLLKKIMIEIYEKFEGDYKNLEKLPFEIKRDILNIRKKPLLSILYSIHFFLEKSVTLEKEGERSKYHNLAYELLLKGFNFAKDFDLGLVYYFRFSIYEYLLENNDCFFSKDFEVLLGNLLPFEYETDDGKFLWDNYYRDHLLKLGVYAEKLVIYVTPYVLKVNLKLLMFDYGKDYIIETKTFLSHLPDKPQIMSLYRKCHYDVVYSRSYFNKFGNLISNYCRFNEEFKVLIESVVENYRAVNKTLSGTDWENKSAMFTNKKLEKVTAAPNVETKAETKIDDINSYELVEESAENISEALKDQNSFVSKYQAFMKQAKPLFISKETASLKKLKEDFIKVNLKENGEVQSLKIKKIRSKLCGVCFSEVSNKECSLTLPCECVVCSDGCFDVYITTILSSIENKTTTACFCSTTYTGTELLLLVNLLKLRNITAGVKLLLANFTQNFLGCCFNCTKSINLRDQNSFQKLALTDNDFAETFNFMSFSHKLCSSCQTTVIKKDSPKVSCKICNKDHNITA